MLRSKQHSLTYYLHLEPDNFRKVTCLIELYSVSPFEKFDFFNLYFVHINHVSSSAGNVLFALI